MPGLAGLETLTGGWDLSLTKADTWAAALSSPTSPWLGQTAPTCLPPILLGGGTWRRQPSGSGSPGGARGQSCCTSRSGHSTRRIAGAAAWDLRPPEPSLSLLSLELLGFELGAPHKSEY